MKNKLVPMILFSFLLLSTYMEVSAQGTLKFPDTGMTSNFTTTINPGTLTVDIVDGSYASVTSPTVVLSPVTFGFVCQSSTGTFGSASQTIYVKNPDAADNGWTVDLAAAAPTASWASVGTNMDFNDPTAAGCTDGPDADNLKGQMTVDPSAATLLVGGCSSCTTTGITRGSSVAFNESTVNSINILTGAVGANDIGDWKLTGISISQTIPAEQPAASDYTFPLTLSVVAS